MSFDLTVYLCRNQVSTELSVLQMFDIEWSEINFLGLSFLRSFSVFIFCFYFQWISNCLYVCVCLYIKKEREREREHGLKSLEVLQHTVQTYI